MSGHLGAALAGEVFALGDDEMEIGTGQHGEAGKSKGPLASADETAETMLNFLLEDLDVQAGEDLLVIVNGTGATTLVGWKSCDLMVMN